MLTICRKKPLFQCHKIKTAHNCDTARPFYVPFYEHKSAVHTRLRGERDIPNCR